MQPDAAFITLARRCHRSSTTVQRGTFTLSHRLGAPPSYVLALVLGDVAFVSALPAGVSCSSWRAARACLYDQSPIVGLVNAMPTTDEKDWMPGWQAVIEPERGEERTHPTRVGRTMAGGNC
jgi:hypothetical protein